jgi:DNA-directed RNA polymerase subunit RPC12/RpoP
MAWLKPMPTIKSGKFPAARSSVCTLLGHKVHYTRIASEAGTPCARCGTAILDRGHSVSRIAHTLSCFFGKHHYVPIATRAAHHEYLCGKCGHSLLFELARNPHPSHSGFEKRVSYGCGLFGHRVHIVATRSNATEYACLCGHSFIKAQRALTMIRHPLACVMLGHFVSVNEIRGDWAEYVCHRCGHPFYFELAGFAQPECTGAASL